MDAIRAHEEEITRYAFDTPGRHEVQWRPGELASNVLVITVGAPGG